MVATGSSIEHLSRPGLTVIREHVMSELHDEITRPQPKGSRALFVSEASMQKRGRDAGSGRFLSVEEARARGDHATVEAVPSQSVTEAMIAAGVAVLKAFAETYQEPDAGDERRLAIDVYVAMRKARPS